MRHKQNKSFTLIEMLIVVVIIGILAAALIPRLQSVQARARDTKRKADLHQIATALAIYKEDNWGYNWLKNFANDWDTSYSLTSYRDGGDCYTDYNPDNNDSTSNNNNLYLMQVILPKYMTSIPLDSDNSSSRRINDDVCWDNNNIHGYEAIFLSRNGSENDWHTLPINAVVLIARSESDWASTNWVVNTALGWSNYPTRDWEGKSDAWFTPNWSPWLWSIGAIHDEWRAWWTPQTYEKFMCNKTSFTNTPNDACLAGNDANSCLTYNDGSWNCTVNKNADDMRYIYVE